MNDLLFYALLLALLYYFFYYLPQQKKLSANPPLKHHKSSQTETIPDENTYNFPGPEIDPQELESLKTELKTQEKDYQAQIKDQKNQIITLQTQIRDLAKRPLKPTNNKGIQTENDTEQVLDSLIKDIQELNNEL